MSRTALDSRPSARCRADPGLGGHREPAQQRARLRPHPLRVPEVAGVVVGHGHRQRVPLGDRAELVQQLSEQMHAAAAELQFELAARLRDEISDLKKELRQMLEATR